MYVRDAKNRDEVWLLDHIEAMGVDEASFRSRDYVVAVDEAAGERVGFGRLRVHRTDAGETCELTGIGVLDGWRRQGVGAHVVERLVTYATDDGFETVYAVATAPDWLSEFGFEAVPTADLPPVLVDRLDAKRETVDPDVVAMRAAVDAVMIPDRLRERFKRAAAEDEEPTDETSAEEFGIDPDRATYKYDVR
ncbi:GNAT family N-acetyltransferase [Halobacteriales archaeon SW_7_68_16]|nr:MAG: GNAT family N-acetyltransferase [Halobacteriales archaeon SW_7_68_16]